jgi:probable F420-dependent oxidoreductase
MRFSIGLPTCMEGMMYPVPFISPDQLVEVARHAEALGYHSVWGNDHMTTQRYVRSEFSTPPNFWEILVALSFIAAQTRTLRVATGVLVPAMRRDIVVMAKQLATLDQFSGGRLIVGMGVGAYREEFEALHPGWQVRRGDVLEESIQALQLLSRERVASWQGQYYHFENVEMFPKPLQAPLPIYVGGNNENAVRRAALYAQGWMGAGMPAEQMRPNIQRLREIATLHGRDPNTIDIAPQFVACIDRTHEAAVQRFHRSQMFKHLVSLSGSTLKDQVAAGVKFEEMDLIGTPDEIVDKISRLGEVGVTHICGTLFTANSVDEYKDQMQLFADYVMPHFRADQESRP